LLGANFTAAQTPSPALLVLEKSDHSLAIVDPENLQIVARVPAGPDPHEIVASPDGKLAYISNYGGLDSALNTISVIDLAAQESVAADLSRRAALRAWLGVRWRQAVLHRGDKQGHWPLRSCHAKH